MKSDYVFYWVLSVALFGAGIIWSPILLGAFKDSKDFFETLSYIATIVAACVAVTTLNSWKSQFRLQRRYEDLQKLREALNGLGMVSRLLKKFSDYHVKFRELGGDESKMSPQYKQEMEVVFLEWSGAVNRYSYCWRVCRPLLNVRGCTALEEVSPDKIREIFYRFKVDFRQAYELLLDDSLGVAKHLHEVCKELDERFEAADAALSKAINEHGR